MFRWYGQPPRQNPMSHNCSQHDGLKTWEGSLNLELLHNKPGIHYSTDICHISSSYSWNRRTHTEHNKKEEMGEARDISDIPLLSCFSEKIGRAGRWGRARCQLEGNPATMLRPNEDPFYPRIYPLNKDKKSLVCLMAQIMSSFQSFLN